MLLHNLIPGAVISFLQKDGLPARQDALSEISRNIESVWSDQSGAVPEAADLGTPRMSTGSTRTDRSLEDRL
jgi:hypothetical protein